MKRIVLPLLILLTATITNAQDEIKPLIYAHYSTPVIELYKNSEKLLNDFNSEFKKIKQGFEEIDATPYEKKSIQNTIYHMDELFAHLDFPGIIIMGYVSPDKAVREAALKCEEQVDEYLSSFLLRKGTYKALVDLRKKYQGKLSSEEKRWLDEFIKDFEMQGVQLKGKERARLEEINSQLSRLSLEFSKNIRDKDADIVMSAEELKGIPASALERLLRDDNGNYILKTDYPTHDSVMKYAQSPDTRKRYIQLFLNRAYPENIPLLEKILTLKKVMLTVCKLYIYT